MKGSFQVPVDKLNKASLPLKVGLMEPKMPVALEGKILYLQYHKELKLFTTELGLVYTLNLIQTNLILIKFISQ